MVKERGERGAQGGGIEGGGGGLLAERK